MEEPKHKDIGPIRVTSPGATASIRVTKAKPPKPPEKPPWQQFMDLNWNALEWLAGNPIVRWVVGSSIWTWLFGRRREPAEAWQV